MIASQSPFATFTVLNTRERVLRAGFSASKPSILGDS
jgi:hypothetical protein